MMDSRSPAYLPAPAFEPERDYYDNSPYSVVSDLPEYDEQEYDPAVYGPQSLLMLTNTDSGTGVYDYDYAARTGYRDDHSSASSAGMSDDGRSDMSSHNSPFPSPRLDLPQEPRMENHGHQPHQLVIPESQQPTINAPDGNGGGPQMNLIPATPLSAIEGSNALNISSFRRSNSEGVLK